MYYLKKDGKILGPFPLDKLQNMVAKGRLTPDNSISEDRENWIEASFIKELFSDMTEKKPAMPPILKKTPEPAPPEEPSEKLKVKPRQKDSYVDKMAPSTTVEPLIEPKPDSVETEAPKEKINLMAIFWNPIQALPEVCESSSKNKLIGISFLFLFLNSIFLVVALCLSKLFPVKIGSILVSCFLAIVPWGVLFLLMLILTKIFAEKEESRNHETMLISTAVFFPASLLLMLVAFINLIGLFSVTQIVVLLAGLGIYFTAFAVLLLFNACTRILGIKGSGTVFVVSTLLMVSVGISGFLVKLLLV